jgi:hypothetical protein
MISDLLFRYVIFKCRLRDGEAGTVYFELTNQLSFLNCKKIKLMILVKKKAVRLSKVNNPKAYQKMI